MLRQPICRAIRSKTVLIFSYHDEIREVEPHILGLTRAGNLVLSGWQRSGERPGWRNFHVDEIGELTRTVIRFKTVRDGYNPDDNTFDRVICRLEGAPAGRRARAER